MILIHLLVFLIGLAVVIGTVFSAVETFVVPRSTRDSLTRVVFISIRWLFDWLLKYRRTYPERDQLMAFFAPTSLLALPPVWLIIILLGYTGMFWSLGVATWGEALKVSGSSLLTLGFASGNTLVQHLLSFSEASLGLFLVALLIAYLPTMYAAFSRREAAVTLLEVRAGDPPSAVEMIKRFYRIHGLGALGEQWSIWETWFVDIEESHTSLAAMAFFRSSSPHHSWITAAGAVLDAAALTLSTVDTPHDPRGDLCIRAGYLALRHIADVFGISYSRTPNPNDPISVTRAEYDEALTQLIEQGVPLKPDLEKAWCDYRGWRVNYDVPLVHLAALVMAPEAPWSSDRR